MALFAVGVISCVLRYSGVSGLTASEWKKRTVYQVVTDRFALGDGDRDTCEENSKSCHEGPACGGTWKGLTGKLDYIQGMGFDAIWISPVIDNTPCGYHGYWPRRIDRLASSMGTPEDLKNLMQTAKSKGIAVMFDSFFNHLGPIGDDSLDMYGPLNKPEYFHGGFGLATLDGTADNEECTNFNYTNPFNFSAGHCLSKCAPLQYFREVCWMGDGLNQVPDLNQDHPDVSNLLISQTKKLLEEYKFDGLRIDAAPYMNRSFLQRMKKEVLSDIWTMGEVLLVETTEFFASFMEQPDKKALENNTKEDIGNIEADHVEGKILDAVANHELFNGIRDALLMSGDEEDEDQRQGSLHALKGMWMKLARKYPDIGALTNFVDSHDEERWHLKSPDYDTYKNALTLAFFLPGIPVVLYGSEQGVRGGSSDSEIRLPMWRSESGYNETSDLYQWTRRLVAARKYMLSSVSDDAIDEVKYLESAAHFITFHRGNTVVVVTKHRTSYLVDLEVSIPTHLPPHTLLCDALDYDSNKNYCARVTKLGTLDVKLNGRPRLMAPPQGDAVNKFLLYIVRSMVPFWLLPLLVFCIISCTQKRLVHIIKPLTPEQIDGPDPDPACEDEGPNGSGKKTVLIASIEHIIVPTEGKTVKVVAGGLGKVAGLLCQNHPGPMISVHPCMCEHDYSFATPDEDGFVYANLMGEEKTCQTFRYKRAAVNGGPPVTFILVDHPMFRDRKDGIYPAPNTRGSVLAFYSLWNQVVAKVIEREKPDIFHCPDYHNAMAVLYIERPIPVVVTLHNAEYQGTVETQQMRAPEIRWLADMFNLDEDVIRTECISDGSFNMLLPIVKYCKKYQRGYGICGVSRTYAQECFQKYHIFWGLPELRGIENCMPESERFVPAEAGEEKYLEQRRVAKENIQREYDLDLDPDARLFVFLGRWVKQKGMDYITDVAEWMLSEFPKAQLVMIGPVGDSYGSYCRMKMQGLLDSKKFEHRLFVYAGFLSVSKDLKLAADFCLMPSRDEPFGYVDIEFAWYGAAIVGSFRGGLAKLPGFYFKVLNKDSPVHCQGCLKKVVSAAMTCDSSVLQEMSVEARKSTFSVQGWCDELLRFYGAALSNFQYTPKVAENSKVEPIQTMPGLEKPLLADEKANSLDLPAKPALKNGNQPRGMPTILSGTNLAAMGAADDPMEDIPQFSHEQFVVNFQDNSDAMSVTSLETSQDYERRRSPQSAWSRQVTPMLSMAREHSGPGGREPSGLSIRSNEFLRSTTRETSGGAEQEAEPELELSKEFLRQEPLEEDVTGIVEAKSAIATFTKQDGKNADVLLEETLWDLELSQEFHKTSRMLGGHICGIPAIDWIISFTYVVGPLTSIALMGTASYRSTTAFEDHKWEVQKLVTQGLSTIVWTFLSCKIRAHKLMAFAVFIRVFQAFMVIDHNADAHETISITAILCGTIQAGDIVLIYFAFMAQSVGDISKLAVRTGLTMALQSMTKWLITPLHELHEPSKILESILFGIFFAISVVVPCVLLRAPQAYRNFSQPNFWPQFAGLFRLKVAALMGLSTVFSGLTYAPANLFLVWRSQAPRPDNFQEFCIVSALASLAAPVLLAILTLRAPDSSINIVKAFACFSFPAFALQCWPLLEVTHAASHRGSLMWTLDAVSVMSVILDVMRVMSSGVAILSTVGSRWRFSAYLCIIQVLSYFSSAISFSLVEACTASEEPLEIVAEMRPAFLTDKLMIMALILCIPELLCRVSAFRFLDQEMLGTLWTARHRKMEAMLSRRS